MAICTPVSTRTSRFRALRAAFMAGGVCDPDGEGWDAFGAVCSTGMGHRLSIDPLSNP